MISSITAERASARSIPPILSTDPSMVATPASTPPVRMTAAAATADQATARRHPTRPAAAAAASGANSGAASTAVPPATAVSCSPPLTGPLPSGALLSSSVPQLPQLVQVGAPERQPHPGGQHLQHQHHQQQVQGHAELHDERDTGGGQERGRGDAVVHQQKPDHLRERAAAGDQDEEAQEHHGQRDRQGLRRGGGGQRDQRAADRVRQQRQQRPASRDAATFTNGSVSRASPVSRSTRSSTAGSTTALSASTPAATAYSSLLPSRAPSSAARAASSTPCTTSRRTIAASSRRHRISTAASSSAPQMRLSVCTYTVSLTGGRRPMEWSMGCLLYTSDAADEE